MRRAAVLTVVVACALSVWGQNPAELFEKAPPDIDEALRARINKFYQYHVEGKFRAADALVAEDSKDVFFGADKQRCRSFAITKISYSDNFTRASAMVICDTEMMMPPVGLIPIKMPIRSLWKVENGEWYWYVEPPPPGSSLNSMFGVPGPAGPPPNSTGAAGAPSAPAAPGPPITFTPLLDLETLQNAVRADRTSVTFAVGTKGTERIQLANRLPGGVRLELRPAKLPGFEISLDKENLEKGESATLSITYLAAADSKPGATALVVVVTPAEQEIPIRIEVK
ncbi:MAG: hypothetical protein K6T61_03890 [Bryobacteraceae bacterium]|nr:hypothetical protein [Bryobacteraceae bacterium]